jgi:hypothetical protein
MPKWTEEELRVLSEHVLYDIQVLFRTADRLERYTTRIYTEGELTEEEAIQEGRELPWLEHVTLVEAFAIHARALTEFLFREHGEPGVRETDALAADYFEPGDWRALCPPKESTLDRVPKRVGEEIVHITKKRMELTSELRRWPFAQIAGAVGRPLRVFSDEVSPARIVDGFRDRVWGEFPDYLRAPAAMSWPPDWWPPSTATRIGDLK